MPRKVRGREPGAAIFYKAGRSDRDVTHLPEIEADERCVGYIPYSNAEMEVLIMEIDDAVRQLRVNHDLGKH